MVTKFDLCSKALNDLLPARTQGAVAAVKWELNNNRLKPGRQKTYAKFLSQ